MIEKSAFTDGSFQPNSVGSGIDVLKSASNFCHLIVSMKEIFLENFSFIAQFSVFLWLWLFKVLGIVQKFPVCKFL